MANKTDESIYSQGNTVYAGGVPIGKVGTAVANNGGAGSGSPTGGSPASGSGSADPDAGLSMDAYRAKYGVPSGGGGSSGGYYRSTGAKQPDRTGYLRSARELGKLYDINYDMDAIRQIYDNATEAKYNLLRKELQQGENTFYSNQANANATLLDTLRKATSSAIATGASRGLASAEQLGLMMEQQQSIVDEATQLAQERANMADKIAQEKAENIVNAMEYSDELKRALAGVSSNVYSSDTQYDVGLLDFYSKLREVEASLYNTDVNKQVQDDARNENARQFDEKLAYDKGRDAVTDQQWADTMDFNRWAKQGDWDSAAAQTAAQIEAARINAAAYSRGSGGSGYDRWTWLDDLRDAERVEKEAYAAGNVSLYIAARRQQTQEDYDKIKKDIDSDPNFPGSKAWQKAQEKAIKEQTKQFKKQQSIPAKITSTMDNVFSNSQNRDTLYLKEYLNNLQDLQSIVNQASKK